MSRRAGNLRSAWGCEREQGAGAPRRGDATVASRSRPPERNLRLAITFQWFGTILLKGTPVATGELALATDNVRYDLAMNLLEVA
jgi:hypothetical protein